ALPLPATGDDDGARQSNLYSARGGMLTLHVRSPGSGDSQGRAPRAPDRFASKSSRTPFPKETDMRSRTRSFVPLALVSILALAGCAGKKSADEIVIGEYGSLTGNDATFGQSTKEGVELALGELQGSQQGKIGDLAVRTVVEDDRGLPEEA